MVTGRPRSRLAADEISEVLGDRRYIARYYIQELKERLLGPYRPGLVGVSRFYKWTSPPVIVDFEPPRIEGEFYAEPKRRYCYEHGIVYIPIYLSERLTKAQFADRVKEERAGMEQGSKWHKEDDALRRASNDAGLLLTPEVELQINQEALRRLAKEIDGNTHLRGASRAKRLRRIKLAVMQEARKNGARKQGLGEGITGAFPRTVS